MKRFTLFVFIVLTFNSMYSQKADFKAAEKFRGDNLTSRYGDLSVNPTWIEESDIFWYSFKTSAGKNYYYVNAAVKIKTAYVRQQVHGFRIEEAYPSSLQ